MTGPVNVKTISTLMVGPVNVKKYTLNVKTGWSVAWPVRGQFGQVGRPGQFFRHFQVSECQHSKS